VAERMADARAHVGAHEFWPHGDDEPQAVEGEGEDVDEHEEVRS
jgi:hypothetical protein